MSQFSEGFSSFTGKVWCLFVIWVFPRDFPVFLEKRDVFLLPLPVSHQSPSHLLLIFQILLNLRPDSLVAKLAMRCPSSFGRIHPQIQVYTDTWEIGKCQQYFPMIFCNLLHCIINILSSFDLGGPMLVPFPQYLHLSCPPFIQTKLPVIDNIPNVIDNMSNVIDNMPNLIFHIYSYTQCCPLWYANY